MSERSNFLAKHFGLRGIAIFEAGKGLLALAGGFWLFSLRHKDLQLVAEHILETLHINPDHNFYRAFMRGAGHVTTRTLWLMVSGVLVYVAIRFIEAIGLWLAREWAEWFALLSSAMYMPWEIYELVRRASAIKWGIFSVNVIIVLYLLWLRIVIHREKKAAKALP
ncbi:MAG TPA: DUF2127 domain-containing protein [Candidatus Saccharimonadales bacterium]|jgi:uncharacterized membrane protein (DUF2068 family)|nr:DUF2127 domain-containing protein [Candidatus Saccharimonadales bacterium]